MTDESIPKGESLLKFPCDFTLKIFGLKSDAFEAAVFGIIHKHVPNVADRAFVLRPSQKGKYCALSVTIHAESKEQLDSLYQELSSSPQVIIVL